ncbi:MAG: NAD-binding protein [Anaerolineales bacterium]|jgi:Trk K+ transport system NAD-binding subunit|nr:NAD-binding protein [Anaerolineales bacterium]
MSVSWRKWRASWRDTLLLLREFSRPLSIFVAAIVGSGLLYFAVSARVGGEIDSLAEAIYSTLSLSFLQPLGDFPSHPALQVFYFIMPVIGIGLLATGLTDFGVMLFNRRARSKEWEMAVASTFTNHTILVGLGHLGYRVVQNLYEMEEALVVIELNPSADLIATVQAMNIPVLQQDATRQMALEAAGIRQARTIVLCSQNDSTNLKIAVKARSLNPAIRVVIRIFDDDFAQSLQEQFGFSAMSATSMAAPAFAAAAAGADVTRPITVEGQSFSLGRLKIGKTSKLSGLDLASIEQKYDLSVVLLKRAGEPDTHPSGSRTLLEGDTIAVLGNPQRISLLVHDSQ